MPGLGCRWELPVVRDSGVVRLLAASGTNFLVNPAFVSGTFTGLFRGRHGKLLVIKIGI